MANIRDLKNRVRSVKNTAQITKAMQMVAASRMKSAQDRALAAIPYAEGLYEIVGRLGSSSSVSGPFFDKREIRNIGFLIVAPARGFCGGLISAMMAEVNRQQKELKDEHSNVKIKAITVQKQAFKIASKLDIEVLAHFKKDLDKPTTQDIYPVFKTCRDHFVNGDIDELYMIYPVFINTMIQKPMTKKILPVTWEGLEEEAETSGKVDKVESSYVFEPSEGEIIDMLVEQYTESVVYSAVLEEIASEESARMVAMKSATDNAKELAKGLTLEMNRVRQAKITQEILEIANGAAV